MTDADSPDRPHIEHPRLVACALLTERHVAAAGWDQPVRLFALVETAKLIAAEPALADRLDDTLPGALSAVEQEDLPPTDPLDDFLAWLSWPAEVDGLALAVERIVVPPEAEAGLPDDPEEAAQALVAHPDRVDVRLFAAVTRDGESTCLLRQRTHDSDEAVAVGHDIAPGLLTALAATLTE
ncbi:MAG: PPA1309 family protein [Dermatophilaceae bacterium]